MRKRISQGRSYCSPLLKKVATSALAAAVACSFTPVAAFASPVAGGQGAGQASGPEFKDGEIIVTLDNATGSHRIATQSAHALSDEIESTLGADSVETIADASKDSGTVVSIDLADGMSVEAAVAKASKLDGVAHAQPNYIYRLLENNAPAATDGGNDDPSADGAQAPSMALYDDPFMDEQYYLDGWDDGKTDGNGTQYRGANVKQAWNTTIANHSVSIAVLDTGAYLNHEDLQENIDREHMWDAFSYPDPAEGMGKLTSGSNPSGDRNGHGSHVCGIAAGAAGNGVGIAGASANANVIPIKVFDNQSYNPGAETATLVKAYDYLLDLVKTDEVKDLHVVNMSLGSYGIEGRDEVDAALENRITQARDEGILTVCAGGNGNEDGTPRTDAMYPSDYEDVLSVTALNPDGTNVSWSDYNAAKDISAPGVDILSCYNQSPQSYATLDGTSMASPLVAGIASLLWAAKPSLTVDKAVTAIEKTAQPLDKNGSNYHGDGDLSSGSATGSHGIIDAAAAVKDIASGASANYKRMADYKIDAIADQLVEDWTTPVEPSIVVKGSDGVELDPSNYKVRYVANDKVGTATVMAIGQGEYIGSTRAEFDIKYDFTKAKGLDLVLSKTQFDADGQDHKPAVMAVHNRADKMSTYILEEGKDFEVAYPADTASVGTKSVTITGKGDYSGERTMTYSVNNAPSGGSSSGGTAPSPSPSPTPTPTPTPNPTKTDLKANATIADIADQLYVGYAITPAVKVTAGGKALSAGNDYEVSYAYNVDAGTATAFVRGKGDYTGSLSKRFKILPADISAADIDGIGQQVYSGIALTPGAIVSIGNKMLVEGEDYELDYRDNTNAGKAILIVNGTGNYKGSTEAVFDIDKAAQKLSIKTKTAMLKASALAKKARSTKWISKVSGAKGKVSFKKTSGAGFLSIDKKTGKVTVKKGTKKGIYMAQVSINAAATANHAKSSKTAFITVSVK